MAVEIRRTLTHVQDTFIEGGFTLEAPTRRSLEREAALDECVLHVGQGAADFDGHGRASSRSVAEGAGQANCGMTRSMNVARERFCCAMSSPMEA